MLYIGRQIQQGVTKGAPSPSGGKHEYYTLYELMIITTFYYTVLLNNTLNYQDVDFNKLR